MGPNNGGEWRKKNHRKRNSTTLIDNIYFVKCISQNANLAPMQILKQGMHATQSCCYECMCNQRKSRISVGHIMFWDQRSINQWILLFPPYSYAFLTRPAKITKLSSGKQILDN